MPIALKYDKNAERKVLVQFTNGIPNESCEFHAELYEHENQTNPTLKRRRILVVRGQHLTYVGNNWEEREKYPDMPEKLVTEHNRKKGVVQVFETDCFKMSPILLNEIKKVAGSKDEERLKLKKQLEEDDRTFSKKQDDLTEVFGSHKRKRAMTARQRNKVDQNSAVEIQKAVEAVLAADESALITDDATAESASILPHNKDAQRPEEVYPLLSVFPETILSLLEGEGEQLIRPSRETIAQWRSEGGELACDYVCSHAQYPLIAVTRERQVHMRYACCLRLFAYYTRMYKFKYSDIRQRSCMEDVNENVRSWLFKEYTVGEGKNMKMPPRLKDKILAHAIVLAWHIDSFTTKEDVMLSAFGISSRKFGKSVNALGGQFKTTGGAKSAVLALPLKFPIIGGRRGR